MDASEVREQQRQLWNEFSPGWRKWDGFVMDWLRPVGERLLDELQLRDGDVVLDVATGTGEPGLSAAARVGGGRVIATDISGEMVSLANANARARAISNYEARAASEEALPFDAGTFDAVVCRFGIMYFGDPAGGVREAARVLRSGGRLAFAAWSDRADNPWATVAAAVISERLQLPAPPPDAPGVFRHAGGGVLAGLLTQAGLGQVTTESVQGEVRFPSAERYWELITDVVAPIAVALRQAGDDLRRQIKREVEEAANAHRKDGEIVFGWRSWVVSGQKP